MPFVVETVTLPGGIRIPYVEHGRPDGIPVVLVHGYTDSWHSFETVLPHLPASIRALAITQRGHGDATKPSNGYRTEDFVADLAAFLTALGIERAVVVGHSMGSLVAQRFAVDHPDRLLGLVLVGAQVTWRDHPEAIGLQDAVRSVTQEWIDAGFAADFQRSTLAQPLSPAFFDTAVAESLKMPARVWRAAIDECVMEPGCSSRLAGIKVPTLLLCGAEDTLAWDGQASLLAAIPGARLESYAHTGHALHWEMPARFATDLAQFVTRSG